MAIIENRTASTSDEDAIAELPEIVARQRAAFLADPFPSLEEPGGCSGPWPECSSATARRFRRR